MDTEFIEETNRELIAQEDGELCGENLFGVDQKMINDPIQGIDPESEICEKNMFQPETREDNLNNNENTEEDTLIFDQTTNNDIAYIRQAIERVSEDIVKMKYSIDTDIIKGYNSLINSLQISVASNKAHEESIYKELEIARKDEHFVRIRPFLDFIADLHAELVESLVDYEEDCEKLVSDYTEKGYKDIISLHKYIIKKIEGELSRQGVEIVDYESGTEFNAAEQTTIKKTINTDDDLLVGKIAEVMSSCYRYGEKVIRKAKVCLYKK